MAYHHLDWPEEFRFNNDDISRFMNFIEEYGGTESYLHWNDDSDYDVIKRWAFIVKNDLPDEFVFKFKNFGYSSRWQEFVKIMRDKPEYLEQFDLFDNDYIEYVRQCTLKYETLSPVLEKESDIVLIMRYSKHIYTNHSREDIMFELGAMNTRKLTNLKQYEELVERLKKYDEK